MHCPEFTFSKLPIFLYTYRVPTFYKGGIYLIIYFSLISLVFIYYAFYKGNHNTHHVVINRVTPFPINDDSPTENSIRVLQLSDLHLEHISISPEELYRSLKNEEFDLIALTGDFLDRPKSIPKLVSYLKVLEELNPRYGMYAVFGNHDYKLSKKYFGQLKETLKMFNVETMQNENKVIDVNGNLIQLIGIDDHHSKKHDMFRSYTGITDKAFKFVLTHDPNIVVHMKNYHFDYLISGHFHGGQICYPKPYHLQKFGKLVRLNLIKGLIRYDGKVFYINEGLGQTGFNIRIGSRPEITIHEINISSENELVLETAI